MTMKNLDGLQLETGSYSGQIKDAMNVNGGDVDSANAVDYVMHFLTFFWKVRLTNVIFIVFHNFSRFNSVLLKIRICDFTGL